MTLSLYWFFDLPQKSAAPLEGSRRGVRARVVGGRRHGPLRLPPAVQVVLRGGAFQK